VDLESTIIAVSSPPGPSALGLIRLSGQDAGLVLETLCEGVSIQQRCIRHVRLVLAEYSIPTTVLCMPGPHSYTTEDTLELQVPGNPLLLEHIIDAMVEAGKRLGLAARRAYPGEFTFRAWHYGRLSLDGAEAVASLIAAESAEELVAARHAFEGAIGQSLLPVADQLADVLALLETGIDFSDEEDVVILSVGDFSARLLGVLSGLDAVLDSTHGSEAIDSRPRVVLRGPANAGKSTLFNALLGQDRVIAHELPGTTRDVISESCVFGGCDALLVDTPGDESVVDAGAVFAELESDLVLWCGPASMEQTGPLNALRVVTKIDICPCTDAHVIPVCSFNATDMTMLANVVAGELQARRSSPASGRVAVSQRQAVTLRRVHDLVSGVRSEIQHLGPTQGVDRPAECAASLRIALNDVGSITGDIPPDDVLGRVFAGFCIGK
jgi:tRNA modification GTPase